MRIHDYELLTLIFLSHPDNRVSTRADIPGLQTKAKKPHKGMPKLEEMGLVKVTRGKPASIELTEAGVAYVNRLIEVAQDVL